VAVQTWSEADVVLDGVFGSVSVRGGKVDSTIERLIAAAGSGKRADIAGATVMIEQHCRRGGTGAN